MDTINKYNRVDLIHAIAPVVGRSPQICYQVHPPGSLPLYSSNCETDACAVTFLHVMMIIHIIVELGTVIIIHVLYHQIIIIHHLLNLIGVPIMEFFQAENV